MEIYYTQRDAFENENEINFYFHHEVDPIIEEVPQMLYLECHPIPDPVAGEQRDVDVGEQRDADAGEQRDADAGEQRDVDAGEQIDGGGEERDVGGGASLLSPCLKKLEVTS